MALQLGRSIVAITVLCFECACLIGVGASTETFAEADASPYDHEIVENGSHLLHNGSHEGVHLVSWQFDYVRQPLIFSLFLILVALCKLAFHHANFLSRHVPESCVLIALGTGVGGLLLYTEGDQHIGEFRHLTPSLFFLYLLPPTVLEASYSLHDRVFFSNLGTILLFAVVGTLLNFFLIGPALYGIAISGAMGPINISLMECFVFSSIIVAVDPVAVLAIFQEIGVNDVLYFLVFGESLLNDAVTVVLYNTVKTFNAMDSIPPEQYLLAVGNFFTVSLGGLFIGFIFGCLTAIMTRFTEHVRVVEPLAVFVFAYTAYLTAELFHFSGIISMIGCGLLQAQYAFHNISNKSNITVKYFSKMLSATCDCVIFLYLGLALVRQHVWNVGFIVWAIVLCLIVRFIVVYALTFLANSCNRVRYIDVWEQFIMGYGGLRGAVAFSLVNLILPTELTGNNKNMLETTTLMVILFTVFVQGITVKPLVKVLQITSASKEDKHNLGATITSHVLDHMMAGVEEVLGRKDQNYFREKLHQIDEKYLMKILVSQPVTRDVETMLRYGKIVLQQHYDNLATAAANNFVDDTTVLTKEEMMADESSGESGEEDVFEQSDDTRHLEDYNRAMKKQSKYRPKSERDVPMVNISGPTPPYDRTLSEERERNVVNRWTTYVRRRHTSSKSPTDAESLNKLLTKQNPFRQYHRTYDKNLTHDANNDLVYQLYQKHARTTQHIAKPVKSLTVSPEMKRATWGYGNRSVDVGLERTDADVHKSHTMRPYMMQSLEEEPELSASREVIMRKDLNKRNVSPGARAVGGGDAVDSDEQKPLIRRSMTVEEGRARAHTIESGRLSRLKGAREADPRKSRAHWRALQHSLSTAREAGMTSPTHSPPVDMRTGPTFSSRPPPSPNRDSAAVALVHEETETHRGHDVAHSPSKHGKMIRQDASSADA